MVLTTEDEYIPDCYKVQLILCRTVLIWPIKVKNIIIKYIVWIYFGIIALSLALSTLGLLLKVVSSGKLADRSEAIDILTLVSSALYKLLFFSMNHENFKWVVTKCGKFQKMLPKGWLWPTPFCSILHSLSAFVIITFWALCPIFNYLMGVVSWDALPLPINTVAPDLDGFFFGVAYFWGWLSLVSSTQIYMVADVFCFSSIHIVNGAMETLKLRLVNMKSKIPLTDNSGKEPRHEYLKEWIKDHAEVMDYIRRLDMMYRSLIVADVIHAIISLSFAMLQQSASQGILEWIKGTFFFLYCYVHQYLNSYFGQRLIDQQEAIRESVAEIPFLGGSIPMMKSVLMVSSGTLNPVRLSAWRMYFLQYATFVEFVKTLLSWFMVLRQLNDDQK